MPERRVILSERAAMLSELIQLLKPGDEVEGVVTRTTDYGAFVSLVGSDGRMHGAEVRCHAVSKCSCGTFRALTLALHPPRSCSAFCQVNFACTSVVRSRRQ